MPNPRRRLCQGHAEPAPAPLPNGLPTAGTEPTEDGSQTQTGTPRNDPAESSSTSPAGPPDSYSFTDQRFFRSGSASRSLSSTSSVTSPSTFM